ncbi:hypothetical protein SAMN04488020_105153 [Palleronia marisminoris]|nr:hypothetical protein SAMN04488020_105153 [Palleronia marisminoris]
MPRLSNGIRKGTRHVLSVDLYRGRLDAKKLSHRTRRSVVLIQPRHRRGARVWCIRRARRPDAIGLRQSRNCTAEYQRRLRVPQQTESHADITPSTLPRQRGGILFRFRGCGLSARCGIGLRMFLRFRADSIRGALVRDPRFFGRLVYYGLMAGYRGPRYPWPTIRTPGRRRASIPIVPEDGAGGCLSGYCAARNAQSR